MKRLVVLLFSLLAVIFVWLSVVTHTVDAAIIYDNGSPDLVDAVASDFIYPQQAGDDFVLNAGANVITDIHWWGLYFAQFPDNDAFSLRIFNITAGVADTIPFYSNNVGAVTRVDTGNTLISVGLEVFEYSVDVSPISLSPGTPYLLSIVNDSVVPNSWFWALSQESGGNLFYRINDGAAWSNDFLETAFNLTGPSSVPEPSTLLLLGAGLAGVGLMRRRFKK
jgi:hypothetical protein